MARRNVCTSSRASGRSARGPTSRAPRTSNASACSAARYRGEQLDVDVQEGDHVGAGDAVQHRLGPDVDPRRRRRFVVAAGDRDDRPPGGRLQLLAEPGHARLQVGEGGPAAGEADGRTNRVAAPADERAVVSQADGRVAALAPGERVARPAGEDARPAGRVVHAHHRPIGAAQVGDQRRRHERGPPRLVAAAIDDLDDRPPVPFGVDRRLRQPPASRGKAGHRGAR